MTKDVFGLPVATHNLPHTYVSSCQVAKFGGKTKYPPSDRIREVRPQNFKPAGAHTVDAGGGAASASTFRDTAGTFTRP
jgi:hypothetical protein